jgi:hypothetical protein
MLNGGFVCVWTHGSCTLGFNKGRKWIYQLCKCSRCRRNPWNWTDSCLLSSFCQCVSPAGHHKNSNRLQTTWLAPVTVALYSPPRSAPCSLLAITAFLFYICLCSFFNFPTKTLSFWSTIVHLTTLPSHNLSSPRHATLHPIPPLP